MRILLASTMIVAALLSGCNSLPISKSTASDTSDDFLSEDVIRVAQTKRGVEIRIQELLLFDTGKSILKPESEKLLDQAALIINNKTKKDVAIDGHTDNVGSKLVNIRLSAERAEAVKTAFIARGVSPKRLRATGYDSQNPISDNRTEKGRAQNRRVAIFLLDEKIENVNEGGKSAFGGLFDAAGSIFKGLTNVFKGLFGG